MLEAAFDFEDLRAERERLRRQDGRSCRAPARRSRPAALRASGSEKTLPPRGPRTRARGDIRRTRTVVRETDRDIDADRSRMLETVAELRER